MKRPMKRINLVLTASQIYIIELALFEFHSRCLRDGDQKSYDEPQAIQRVSESIKRQVVEDARLKLEKKRVFKYEGSLKKREPNHVKSVVREEKFEN